MYRNDVFLSQLKIIFDTLLKNGEVEKLSDNCELSGGFAFKSTEYKSEGLFVLRVTNIKPDGTIDINDAKYISNDAVLDYEKYSLEAGDVLIVMIGGSIGKVGFVDKKVLPALLNQNMWLVRSKNGLSSRYIFFLCLFLCQFHATEKNTSYSFYSRGKFRNLLAPSITPENSVILSKLFDKILLGKNIDNNSLISINSVNRINLLSHISTYQSKISGEIKNQKTYLTKLRQAILQEAIEGQLTADWRVKNPVCLGDPNTDAAALLATIKAEKQALIADGKIKKEKPLAPINPDDVPFALPDGWVWVRLGEITLYSEAGKSFLCEEREVKDDEWGVVKVSSVSWGYFKERENKFYSKLPPNDLKYQIMAGDFIITRASGSPALLGKSVIVPYIKKNLLLNDKTIRFVFAKHGIKMFVNLFNGSSYAKSHFMNCATGTNTSMRNLTRSDMETLLIPLPPLAEQQAIVERVDRLLNHINALEQQVTERKHHAEQLMQAVLKEAFAG